MSDEMNDANNKQMTETGNRMVFMIIGWISAVLSLFIYPFIFGVVGVVMGVLSTKNGSRTGISIIIASIIAMGIGLIYSGTIMNFTRHYLGI